MRWSERNSLKKKKQFASRNFTSRAVAPYGTALSDFEWRCSEEGAAARYALPMEKKNRRRD